MAAAKKTVSAAKFAAYADKEITPAMQEFAEWLQLNTGYDVDPKSVALAGTLRMRFQEDRRDSSPRAKTGQSAAKATAKPAAAAKPATPVKTTKVAAKPAARRGAAKPADATDDAAPKAPRSGRRGASTKVEAPY
jgi:hypothetical protein